MNDEDFVYPQAEEHLKTLQFGRKMRGFYTSPHWEEALEVLQSYLDDAIEQASTMVPGTPGVMPAQAVLYAIREIRTKFEQDIRDAVQFADKPPQELITYIHGVRDNSDVVMQMDGLENRKY